MERGDIYFLTDSWGQGRHLFPHLLMEVGEAFISAREAFLSSMIDGEWGGIFSLSDRWGEGID